MPEADPRYRLFAGVITMRRDENGTSFLTHEHIVGWSTSREQFLGYWVDVITKRHGGSVMSWHGVYDITDEAERRPSIDPESSVEGTGP